MASADPYDLPDDWCVHCGRDFSTATIRRTGDYERAGSRCLDCHRPVCGYCGDPEYDPDLGSWIRCAQPVLKGPEERKAS